MIDVTEIKNMIINGHEICRDDALKLLEVPLKKLFDAANDIRHHFCGNSFDACTIINVKSGKCSEDCKFCAQSIHYPTDIGYTRYWLEKN